MLHGQTDHTSSQGSHEVYPVLTVRRLPIVLFVVQIHKVLPALAWFTISTQPLNHHRNIMTFHAHFLHQSHTTKKVSKDRKHAINNRPASIVSQ